MNHGLREGKEKGGTKGPPSKPRPPGAPPSQRPTEGYQPRPDSKSPGPPPQGGSGLLPAPRGSGGTAFESDPGWEETAARVIHDPAWAHTLTEIQHAGIGPGEAVRLLLEKKAENAPLTQRQELMSRFVEAQIRAGNTASISCMAQWALDLAKVVLKTEEA